VADVESLGSHSSIAAWPPWLPIGPRVQTHSRRRFRRPATGVSGQESLSDSEDESRLSPSLGERNFSLDLPGRNDNRAEDGVGDDNADSVNDDEDDCDDGSGEVERGSSAVSEGPVLVSEADASEGAESVFSELVDSESRDSMSECFHKYLVV